MIIIINKNIQIDQYLMISQHSIASKQIQINKRGRERAHTQIHDFFLFSKHELQNFMRRELCCCCCDFSCVFCMRSDSPLIIAFTYFTQFQCAHINNFSLFFDDVQYYALLTRPQPMICQMVFAAYIYVFTA